VTFVLPNDKKTKNLRAKKKKKGKKKYNFRPFLPIGPSPNFFVSWSLLKLKVGFVLVGDYISSTLTFELCIFYFEKKSSIILEFPIIY
jgi:hypothetical protein